MGTIKTFIKKYYPPVILTLLFIAGLLVLSVLLNWIEQSTTNLPIQYR
jgi:hypothetical protein